MQMQGGVARQPDDDVWPLELWFSREEALPEDDTWHAGKARGARRSNAGRALGPLGRVWRRDPRGEAEH